MRGCAAPCWPLAALRWVQPVTRSAVGGGRGGPPPPVSPPPVCRSVEALAAVLVPVAVHHHADDDEEDAAQHGEEHGEEYADGAHPFLDLAHWRRERGTRSRGAAGHSGRQAVPVSRLSSSMLSTLGRVISSSSSASSFSLRSTVSW